MEKRNKICRIWGQGILLLCIILGRSAALYENNYAFQTQSIGLETRGGISRAEVVISDNPKDYPKVRNLDILVAMSQESLDIYVKDLYAGKILIYDPDMVINFPDRE